MGFFDALFGRNKPPKAQIDPLFALSTAIISFAELGWESFGRSGLALKPATSIYFQTAAQELRDLLTLYIEETKTKMQIEDDEYHYRWLLFDDPDFDDLVNLVHVSAQTLKENGYDTQLLAAVFRFVQQQKPDSLFYLIYNYKRGNFYPYMPLDKKSEQRDRYEEQRIFTMLERKLPWEKDTTLWYPIRDCPV
ncbi:MAG TPA: hypothetical protein DDY25_05115 [Peptococcaceae bacterium]|nr:hypothetical protein [Peptococcaceae bacterium]